MKKKLLAVFSASMAACVAATALAGCGGLRAEKVDNTPGVVNIVMLEAGYGTEFMDKWIEDFKAIPGNEDIKFLSDSNEKQHQISDNITDSPDNDTDFRHVLRSDQPCRMRQGVWRGRYREKHRQGGTENCPDKQDLQSSHRQQSLSHSNSDSAQDWHYQTCSRSIRDEVGYEISDETCDKHDYKRQPFPERNR